eukprot:1296597-Pyramimonas_sp.AAC.1
MKLLHDPRSPSIQGLPFWNFVLEVDLTWEDIWFASPQFTCVCRCTGPTTRATDLGPVYRRCVDLLLGAQDLLATPTICLNLRMVVLLVRLLVPLPVLVVADNFVVAVPRKRLQRLTLVAHRETEIAQWLSQELGSLDTQECSHRTLT